MDRRPSRSYLAVIELVSICEEATNHNTSTPLLKMPKELRDKIWLLALSPTNAEGDNITVRVLKDGPRIIHLPPLLDVCVQIRTDAAKTSMKYSDLHIPLDLASPTSLTQAWMALTDDFKGLSNCLVIELLHASRIDLAGVEKIIHLATDLLDLSLHALQSLRFIYVEDVVLEGRFGERSKDIIVNNVRRLFQAGYQMRAEGRSGNVQSFAAAVRWLHGFDPAQESVLVDSTTQDDEADDVALRTLVKVNTKGYN